MTSQVVPVCGLFLAFMAGLVVNVLNVILYITIRNATAVVVFGAHISFIIKPSWVNKELRQKKGKIKEESLVNKMD